MAWFDNDPIIEDEPKATRGDWWKSDPLIAEEPSDTFAQDALFPRIPAAHTLLQPSATEPPSDTLRDVLNFPGKVLGAASGVFHPGGPVLHWPTNEEVERPLVGPTVSRIALGIASGGLSESAREAQRQFPQSTAAQIAGGVTEGMTNAVGGVSSTSNIAMLPLGAGRTASKVLAGVFAAQAARHFPEQWKAFNETEDAGEKSRIATEILVGLGLPVAAFLHGGAKPTQEVANLQAVPMVRETQAPSGESLTNTPAEMLREGPPSAEDAKGLPISRPVTQRFVQPEGNPVVPESETTAAITRDALAWRNELLQEGQKLGEQARLMGQMGQRIPKPLADRIAEINAELARGFQPKPQEHYELRGETSDAPIETEHVAAQSESPSTPQSRVRSTTAPFGESVRSESVPSPEVATPVREADIPSVPRPEPVVETTSKEISRPEISTPEVESATGKTVRLYHGGSAEQAGRDFTTSYEYAKGYADKAVGDGKVWYVDVPEGLLKTHDEYGQPMSRVIVPDEIADQAKVFGQEASTANPVQEAPTPETTTGVANRVLKAEAEAGKIEPVEPGEGMSWQEMVDLGREKLNAGADPQMIARRFQRNGRISAEDFAVVRAERERLAGETMAAENAVRQNPNDVNARNNYNAVRQTETEWVRNVVQPAKTATSDIFRGMQGEAPIDPTTFAGLRRAVLDIHGRDVAPNEVQTLSAISERTRRAVAESSESLQRAATAVENTLGRKVKPRSIEELREHLANRIRELTPC